MPCSFIASLTSAKIYNAPPPIEKLSDLFQDFYLQAESHISTHIQALSSKQYRDASPAPSVSSRASTKSTARLNSKTSRDTLSALDRVGTGQQMLTPSEIADRRKARRLLEHKRLALEEAVERRVCEGIYERIWRHKGTLDQIEDEKLRSKTAALALVGIGLKDLGIDLGASNDSGLTSSERAMQVEDSIAKASEGLLKMNESRHPFGKLQSLASTHQTIVDLLSNLHQSSSSADEILPTLIYTLIISPPEGINIISNLRFIQRFRAVSKMNGEAAYCLTNLEAAITFLETVDLASLREEEHIEGPGKSNQLSAANTSTRDGPKNPSPATIPSPVTTPLTAVPPNVSSGFSKPFPISVDGMSTVSPPASPSHQRRLSTLFQPPVNALGAASDAVRTTVDDMGKNISTTLDNSFKLLFGRLKEQHVQGPGSDSHGTIIVPKTLDDARRLVSPKPMVDEDGNISETSSFNEQDDSNPKDDRILDMITGTRQPRDRSVDSAVSNSSGSRRLAFLNEGKNTPTANPSSPITVSTPTSAVESMRSLGNSLNPLNRFAGMNVMRGFGRSASSSAVVNPSLTPGGDSSKESKDTEGVSPPGKVQPPVQRFLEVREVGDLRVAELDALLKDYQRLAGVVKGMGLC